MGGEPEGYAWETRPRTKEVGDVAAKLEARDMIKASKVTEALPVAFGEMDMSVEELSKEGQQVEKNDKEESVMETKAEEEDTSTEQKAEEEESIVEEPKVVNFDKEEKMEIKDENLEETTNVKEKEKA